MKLNYSFQFVSEGATGIVHINYYLDYTPVTQNEYLYDADTISAWNSSSVVYGTIYGICDDDDFENAIEHGSTYLPDVNTSAIYTVYLNSSRPGTLNVGEYHWFKFTAPTAGTYSFYTENSGDTVGELFSTVVPARSMNGLLISNDDGGTGLNFKIEYTLTAGQIVYLRIHDYNWNDARTYSLRVEKLS